MSIIIQFNSSSFIQSAGVVPLKNSCRSKASVKLEMVPGIEHHDVPVPTDDESSMIDIASSNSVFATTFKSGKTTHCCFGLPYQDHNYGAPPPPTPPSYSPCPSPAVDIAIPDEDTNHSIISTTTTTEEAQEESITRCICGFEHDDEYMICCDNCLVWQHVDCMGLDRNNIPETYLCEQCKPRKLDKHKAKLLQARKKNVLTKLPSVKQESCANDLIFGKNYKKKTLLQNPVDWPKGDYGTMPSVSQKFYYTTDSDEEGTNKSSERRPKTRSKRRKREEERVEQSSKRTKAKFGRDRMDAKVTKLKRNKNKESTSTADEEAQDAWEYSMEWCEENFENANNNQYTPEVQHIARMMTTQGFEKKFFEQLQTKKCHVLDDGKIKQLVCLYDLPRNQPLIEYKGKFLLASQFHDIHPLYNKRLYPFVLFYKLDQAEICVDASLYGNDARFVRKSCKPNAEIRHMVYNGKLHLYLQSTKVIFSEDEVTVPHILSPGYNLKDVKCACGSDECILKPKKKNGALDASLEKRRRSRRSTTISADDDSSQSMSCVAPEKPKPSPVKSEPVEATVIPPETSDPVENKGTSDHESEEQSIESRKKLTREERKIDAYVRAFVQMEKAQKRKQQALERMKAQQPKVEELAEKSDSANSNPKEDEKPEKQPVPNVESQCEEEVKPTPPVPKPKKGKRRRGSGTPSRRRTRTNSGGSDILHLEETVLAPSAPINDTPVVPVPLPAPSPVPSTEVPVQTTCTVTSPTTSTVTAAPSSPTTPPPPAVPPASTSPVILKTKRFLLHEWLQEKSEVTPTVSPTVSSPRPLHAGVKWNTPADSATCYVRCTKDTPHSGGITAAHLRRSNSCHVKSAGGQGSAKKRWLRQAMNDCGGSEEQLSIDSCSMEHFDNGCLSPNSHGDVDSPGALTEVDILTPLKKRRLMRESIESAPSPRSPFIENSLDDTDGTSSSLANDIPSDHKSDQQLLCPADEDSSQFSLVKDDNSESKSNDPTCDLTASQDIEIKKEIKMCEEEGSVETTEKDHASVSEGDFVETDKCNTEPTMQPINCDFKIKTEDDDVDNDVIKETSSAVLPTNSSKSSPLKSEVLVSESGLDSKDRKPPADETSLDFTTSDSNCTASNQSAMKEEETCAKDSDEFAQRQPPDPCISESSVNSVNPIKIECTDASINQTSSSEVKEEMTESAKPLIPSSSLEESTSTPLSMQKKLEVISPTEEPLPTTDSGDMDPCESMHVVNNKTDKVDSTNDRPSNVSETLEKIECSATSSSIVFSESSVSNTQSVGSVGEEVVKTPESVDSNVQAQSMSEEPVKPCASATQKRKVSLSEYRMRMQENTNKNRSSVESSGKSANTAVTTTMIPETLPEKVTLAPLPLFDISDSSKTTNKHSTPKKKKETTPNEAVNSDISEHRENLTERLKREFGLEVSDIGLNKKSTSRIQAKEKGNNQTSSAVTHSKIPTCAQPPPPPPPPPPPRLRPPQAPTAVTAPLTPQYGFVHPYPQPPFIVPQVPGARPFIPPQPSLVAPPILPTVHPMNANPGVRPPLLPSSHSFTSLPGTVLRTATGHEFAPINAQRFTMVPQPPPLTQKAYPHVFQSGLYK